MHNRHNLLCAPPYIYSMAPPQRPDFDSIRHASRHSLGCADVCFAVCVSPPPPTAKNPPIQFTRPVCAHITEQCTSAAVAGTDARAAACRLPTPHHHHRAVLRLLIRSRLIRRTCDLHHPHIKRVAAVVARVGVCQRESVRMADCMRY